MSIDAAEIERCAQELYAAGLEIIPRANDLDLLTVLGATSAALFLRLKEAYGAEKTAFLFNLWVMTAAESSELDPTRPFSNFVRS